MHKMKEIYLQHLKMKQMNQNNRWQSMSYTRFISAVSPDQRKCHPKFRRYDEKDNEQESPIDLTVSLALNNNQVRSESDVQSTPIKKIKDPLTTTTDSNVEKCVFKMEFKNNEPNQSDHSKTVIGKSEHISDESYACAQCSKKFDVISRFRAHTRRHVNKENRKYVCEVCQKCFVQNSSLKTHRRIHSGERPFTCEVCDTSFGDFSTFTKHKRIHTKEKPYLCSYSGCERAFSQSGNRNRHYNAVHAKN